MKVSKVCLALSLCSILLVVGCSKDKNMDDLRREQLQESLSRINSISGSYSGSVISKIDGSNLGFIVLKFKASTDIQSNSGRVANDQTAIVSGSINLKSITTTDVSFDSGYYDDVSGNFQVTIPIPQDGGVAEKISLTGHVSGDSWIGSMEVKGQPQNGADLNLQKNAPATNLPSIEVGGIRLEQIRRLDYRFEGLYKYETKTYNLKLSFINKDVLPEQSLYKIFSPIRQVSVNCDFSGFELNFSNANLDDTRGTLIAQNPTDQEGRPARASLNCKKFENGSDFGWDCEIQTKSMNLRTHLAPIL